MVSILKKLGVFCGLSSLLVLSAKANVQAWQRSFQNTNFQKHTVNYNDIESAGFSKDGVSSIDRPVFKEAATISSIGPDEPVICVVLNNEVRGYPIRVLMHHEVVNDNIKGTPIVVTYCPRCNSAIVFRSIVNGDRLEFGVTGKLRKSNLIMYDRQTGTWWQQYTGEGIVGRYVGAELEQIPSMLISFDQLLEKKPDAKILVPNAPNFRPYGQNPYVGYDNARRPFRLDEPYRGSLAPLARVLVVGDEVWSWALLQKERYIKHNDLIIKWFPGQNSALDTPNIATGKDVGNVSVYRQGPLGLEQVPHIITFAFAVDAFQPNAVIWEESLNNGY